MKKCLFLGYNCHQTKLINLIKKQNWQVIQHRQKKPNLSFVKYDLIISFGYRHIIPNSILIKTKRPIINLHMSYLPYNKGAHPNFWSFMENTPKGISLHEVSKKIDSGPIIYRRKIKFTAKDKTFRNTYTKLKLEIEKNFKKKIKKILNKTYKTKKIRLKGTFHKKKDLPQFIKHWDISIFEAKKQFTKFINKKNF